ncbi:MAG: peptidoglycan DD-metalloendopeptidase family protein [Bacteroidota bacterium]
MGKYLGYIIRNVLILTSLGCWSGKGMLMAQDQKEEIETAIRVTEDLLSTSQSQTKKALNSLNLFNRQITLRQRLIRQYAQQIESQQQHVEQLDEIVCQLEEDMTRMVVEYSRVAQLTYQSFYADNFWLAVLSSSSLTEAYYRVIYFRQFSRYRKRQIELIDQTRTYLSEKSVQLSEAIKDTRELRSEKSRELEKLGASQAKQEELYKNYSSVTKTYQDRLDQVRKRLKKIIRQEQDNYLDEGGAVDEAYEENFPRNKGLLPWPVPPSKGAVTGEYGVTEDAFGNRISNDGIYITTEEGQAVKAVYSGRVTAVSKIPLSGSIVILEHGKYRTVYTNLSEVKIKKGDLVSANQTIGRIRTDRRTGETQFQFMIYKVPDKFVDPQKWLIEP